MSVMLQKRTKNSLAEGKDVGDVAEETGQVLTTTVPAGQQTLQLLLVTLQHKHTYSVIQSPCNTNARTALSSHPATQTLV